MSTPPPNSPRSVPQLDPTLTLALALRATPGAYALLLGSGLSRAAGVPTGWDIVLDLLRRVAPAGTDDTPEGLQAWYRTTHGGEPDYSTLLEAVADTPGERRDRLRGYFEPTPDEREQGIKLPTKAHRAIARLVARGYVRVVVTTNFDQLLERADEGERVGGVQLVRVGVRRAAVGRLGARPRPPHAGPVGVEHVRQQHEVAAD